MSRLSIVLVLAALAAACNRGPPDPALVADPQPLTDCGDEAFIAILGGGRAPICRGVDTDAQVRACVEAPFSKREPFVHVSEFGFITVFTPEKRVYQVRHAELGGKPRMELYACQQAPSMPDDELPFFCPLPGENVAAVASGDACGVLERARKLRRQAAGK